MNRDDWHELADQADAIGDAIGKRDEAARAAAVYVATRCRHFAEHPTAPWIEDVHLPGDEPG